MFLALPFLIFLLIPNEVYTEFFSLIAFDIRASQRLTVGFSRDVAGIYAPWANKHLQHPTQWFARYTPFGEDSQRRNSGSVHHVGQVRGG
jgi:hypothetical protein